MTALSQLARTSQNAVVVPVCAELTAIRGVPIRAARKIAFVQNAFVTQAAPRATHGKSLYVSAPAMFNVSERAQDSSDANLPGGSEVQLVMNKLRNA